MLQSCSSHESEISKEKYKEKINQMMVILNKKSVKAQLIN